MTAALPRAVWLTKLPPKPKRSHSEPPEPIEEREQSRLWQALAGDSGIRCRPVLINPELAVILGPTKAAVLGQLNYWMERSEYIDELQRKWCYNTLLEWHVYLPWIGESTIKLAFNEMGVYLDKYKPGNPEPPRSKDGHNLVLIRKHYVSKLRRENFYHLNFPAVAKLNSRAVAIAKELDEMRAIAKQRRRFSGGVRPLLYERHEVGP